MADVEITERSFNETDITKLMGKGKRHYICNEVEDAVKCFEEAAQKLAEQYGELGNECGEAYLYYGKSLIDLARSETGVLGGALKVAGEQNEDDSEDDEEEAGESNHMEMEDSSDKDKNSDDISAAEPAKSTGGEESDKAETSAGPNEENDEAPTKESEAEKEDCDTNETVAKEQQPGDASGSGSNGAEDGGPSTQDSEDTAENSTGAAADINGDAEEKEEDLGTIELAWETLEMSRLIYERQDTKEAKLNLAQTYLKLGEIQMERELFLEAIDEFHKCYEIQETHLEADDRLLAETLYNIGLAYSIHSPPQHNKAKEYYTKALDVIDLRVKNIEARLQEFDAKSKGKQQAFDDDPCVKDRKELMEMQDLRPEIKAKIDDAHEMMNSESSGMEQVQTIAVKKPDGETSKPATDISYLVKRKRKPDETGTSENTDQNGAAKKPRQENGIASTSGHE